MKFNPNDKYAEEARKLGYRARSVFKLQAIQERFKLIKKGDKVLDLGAAPGSFVQYVAEVVGEDGFVVGIDLQNIIPFKEMNIALYKGDIFEDQIYSRIEQETKISQFDTVTSDLAPKTTGVKFMDGGRSLELNLQVLEVCKKYLKKGGNAVMKILPGFNEGDLFSEASKTFKQVKKMRPQAIRKSSGESYVVCLNKTI